MTVSLGSLLTIAAAVALVLLARLVIVAASERGVRRTFGDE